MVTVEGQQLSEELRYKEISEAHVLEKQSKRGEAGDQCTTIFPARNPRMKKTTISRVNSFDMTIQLIVKY